MSSKTTLKRIALVAVSALGLGLFASVAPASAAVATATIDNTTVSYTGRINNQVSITVTGDAASVAAGGNGVSHTMKFAATIISQPSGSTVVPALADSTMGGDWTAAGSAGAGSSSAAATLTYTQATSNTATGALTDASLAALTLTPSHIGSYVVRVWNETDAATTALSGSESYKDFTINVTAGPTAIALTIKNSTASAWMGDANDIPVATEQGAYGSLVKVSLTDSTGAVAALGIGEIVSVDPSGSAAISAVNGTLVTTAVTAGGAYSLTPADFTNGVAWINIADETAETVTVVATYGTVTTNGQIVFKTTALAADQTAAITIAPTADTTGWYRSAANTYTTPLTASVNFTVTDNDATADDDFTSTEYAAARVLDGSGKVLGTTTTGLQYDLAVLNGGTFTVSATFTATGQTFNVTDDSSDIDSPDHTFTSAARDLTTGGTVTTSPSGSIVAAKAGSLVFTATVKDQFGSAYANGRVTAALTSTGRNGTQATQSATTDANGKVTFTITDSAASTVTVTTDTLTITAFDEDSSKAATAVEITWATITVGTVTLTSPGEDDVIAGTTTTDINAAAGGATGTSATVTATVKDANGVVLVGVPVTFAVSGLVGAEVHTTAVTAYTSATGVATSYVSSYAAGKATVTATVGGKSDSDSIYFKQKTATEARTISATSANGGVTATVTDRYGNAIEGVTVNATRASGTGFFANGSSSTSGTTDKNGQVEFKFEGNGSVKVAFTAEDYGQSADASGYVGGTASTGTAVTAAVAGTTTANQKGLGASLAPAGVNSVTVDVVGGASSSDAIDAANEATDAANAATDAANAAAEAADAATAAAQDAQAAVAALATQVASLIAGIKAQITTLTNLVIKIQKKVRA